MIGKINPKILIDFFLPEIYEYSKQDLEIILSNDLVKIKKWANDLGLILDERSGLRSYIERGAGALAEKIHGPDQPATRFLEGS